MGRCQVPEPSRLSSRLRWLWPDQSPLRRACDRAGAAVGAFLIVSADADLTSMSPWRGRPIIEPSQFASPVDASRRARRRR